MADAELKRVGLNPERWVALVAYVNAIKLDQGSASPEPVEIKVDVPIEVDGWIYMPAVYFPA